MYQYKGHLLTYTTRRWDFIFIVQLRISESQLRRIISGDLFPENQEVIFGVSESHFRRFISGESGSHFRRIRKLFSENHFRRIRKSVGVETTPSSHSRRCTRSLTVVSFSSLLGVRWWPLRAFQRKVSFSETNRVLTRCVPPQYIEIKAKWLGSSPTK